jgi:hypothetical protein
MAIDSREREYDRTHATCEVCGESKHERYMMATFPNPGWQECRDCFSRLHPMCACGCNRFASIIADVRWPGGIDCRAPWVDVRHARESVSPPSARTVEWDVAPSIDVILDESDLPKVLSLAKAGVSPCWCAIENMTFIVGQSGLRMHTRLPWCPLHGNKE